MLNKLQTTLAKMKLKALLNSKGEGVLKGFKFREGIRSITIGEVQLRTNLPLMELNLDTIESLQLNHEEYELFLVIKDLKVIAPEGEFSIDELTINSLTELKEFSLELKGVIETMSKKK